MLIKILQVFESYPLFYQPYIPPVLDGLKKVNEFNIKKVSFKGKPNNDKSVTIIPSYFYRRLIEKWYNIRYNKIPKMNYLEYQSIKENIDIIHIQHSYLFSKVKGLIDLSLKNKPKVVITLRGGDTYIKPWLNKKWSDFYRDYGCKVDAFITMSMHQKKYLNDKWGVPLNKIYVIPISFGDMSTVKPKFPNKKVLKIVSAYRMCWEKNIEGSLRVIKKLKESGQVVQYDIYGDGPDSGQVYYLIDKYKLSSCVNYFGRIDNSILKEKLSNYDFFLQLSHSEAFPTSILEAQSQAVPCIVSNSGGLPEAIIHGETGYCVDAYDIDSAEKFILKLFKNKELYYAFSKAGINYVNNNFTVEHEVDRLKMLYENLAIES